MLPNRATYHIHLRVSNLNNSLCSTTKAKSEKHVKLSNIAPAQLLAVMSDIISRGKYFIVGLSPSKTFF